jgi:amino acid permease
MLQHGKGLTVILCTDLYGVNQILIACGQNMLMYYIKMQFMYRVSEKSPYPWNHSIILLHYNRLLSVHNVGIVVILVSLL